jgi:hypothetical protein
MSVKVMAFIWDLPEGVLTSSQKFVAVSYADHADHEGGSIFPAVATIAKKTELTPRTVQRCTRKLESMKLFLPDGKHPKYGTNQWRIDLEWRGDTVSGVTTATESEEETEGGVTSDAVDVSSMSPEPPSLTGKKKKSKEEPSPPAKKAAGKRTPPKKTPRPKKDPRYIVSTKLCEVFENVFHVVRHGEDMDMDIFWHKDNVKETMQRWRKPVKRMHILCRPKTIEGDPGWSSSAKATMEIIQEATQRLMNADKVLTFDAPDQIERTFKSILADRKAASNGVVLQKNIRDTNPSSAEIFAAARKRHGVEVDQ